MSIESDFFSRLVPDRDLLAEGNVPFDGKAWRLSGDILDGRFHVELMIPVSGEVRGSVIEAEVGDEYLPLRAAGAKGAFVTEVRSAYLAFLETVAVLCQRAGQPPVRVDLAVLWGTAGRAV